MSAVDYRAVIGYMEDQMGTIFDTSAETGRIERLIYQAVGDVMSTSHWELREDVATIIDGIIKLPCGMVRLLRVTDLNDRKIGGYNRLHASEYLQLGIRSGQVKVHYYALPTITFIDTDGVERTTPLLSDRMVPYCAWYVIVVLAREMVARGSYNGNLYAEHVEERNNQYQVAKGQIESVSIDEMESAIHMLSAGSFIGRR